MGVPFDLERREVMGQPAPILEGIRGIRGIGNTDYALSNEGTLVYVPDFVGQVQRSLVWVDRKGESEPLTDLQRQFATPKFSPDGARLAITVRSGTAGQNVWIYEMASGILTPFTFQARPVKSDDHVEVHESAVLILDDLGIGEQSVISELEAAHSDHLGQLTLDGDGGPPPQFSGMSVPQHRLPVIEAVGT